MKAWIDTIVICYGLCPYAKTPNYKICVSNGLWENLVDRQEMRFLVIQEAIRLAAKAAKAATPLSTNTVLHTESKQECTTNVADETSFPTTFLVFPQLGTANEFYEFYQNATEQSLGLIGDSGHFKANSPQTKIQAMPFTGERVWREALLENDEDEDDHPLQIDLPTSAPWCTIQLLRFDPDLRVTRSSNQEHPDGDIARQIRSANAQFNQTLCNQEKLSLLQNCRQHRG
jgi:hypothetical protein